MISAPIIVGVVLLLLSLIGKFTGAFDEEKETIVSASTLMDAVDISELSTAQYTYKGIVTKYSNEKQTRIKCRIYYEAKVKAGIDMGEIDFNIDEENKVVRPILPAIKITVKSVDESSIDYMPSNTKIDLKEVLSLCKDDVEKEAMSSMELLNTAENNLKSIIEALLYPILEHQGYIIKWEEI